MLHQYTYTVAECGKPSHRLHSSPASVRVPHYPLQRFIVKSCRPQFHDCKINYSMLVLVLSVTPCGLAAGYQHFRRTHRFHQKEMKLMSACKSTWRYSPKTFISIFTTVRSLNLINDSVFILYVGP